MKAFRNRRLLVAAVGAVAVVVAIATVGALSPRHEIVEAHAQSSLKSALRAPAADGSANGGIAFTVGGMGNIPQGVAAPGRARGAAAAAAPADAVGSETVAAAGPRIVKNGSVEVEVRKHAFGPSFARLTTIATSLGGFVSSSKTFEAADVPNGTVTLRVPSDRFDELVRQVRGLGKVRAVSSSGEDVTARFTDLRARLKALEAQRDQYLLLLTKATSIGDTLAVRDRLNQVQVEIEQLQGQLKLLDDQTSFATLAVNIAEPGHLVAEPERERAGWSKAGHDAVDGFVRGAQAIVAHSGATLLVLLCGVALAVLGRFSWRWVATRMSPADVVQET